MIIKTSKKKKKKGGKKKRKKKNNGIWAEAPGLLMGSKRQQLRQGLQEFPTLGGEPASTKVYGGNAIGAGKSEYSDPFAGKSEVNYLEKSRRGKMGHYHFDKLDKKYSQQSETGEVNYLNQTSKPRKETSGVVMMQSKKKRGKRKKKGKGVRVV